MSFSSSSEKSVIPSSSGLSASGRCEDASFAAMMSLISKNFQEKRVWISLVVGMFQSLWGLGKRSVEHESTRFGSYDQKRTSRANGENPVRDIKTKNEHTAGPKHDGTI
jgi:hypothetical protein